MTLNQEHFEAWLFNQPGDRIIEAGYGNRCVLCSFARETGGMPTAYFDGWDEWSPELRGPKLLLPDWARLLPSHHPTNAAALPETFPGQTIPTRTQTHP